MPTQKEMIDKLFGRGAAPRPPALPRQSVTHDSIDKMVFGNHADDSPRFRRVAVEDAPKVPPNVPDPAPIDFTSAAPDEIKTWQAEARAAKQAREQAPEYDAWENLTRDIFYSYHHSRQPEVLDPEKVDPGVAHHAKIASKMMAEEEHSQSRNITRDKPTAAAIATMAASRALKEALGDELLAQAQAAEEFEQQRDVAEAAMSQLNQLRQQARDLTANGQPIPAQLVADIKAAVTAKRAAQAAAAQAAQGTPVSFTAAAHAAVTAAVQAGAEAAKNAAAMPGFGQGFGEGEPEYDSPEQALSIAEMWANNPMLKAIAQLYGRMERDMRFQRAKRVVGGADEIVDLKFGDDLRRVLPAELASLADEDMEDDFYMRYLGAEIRVWDTVGEEHAGRGPIIISCDESGTMKGERNIWSKALAMCLLNIARREKRDFAYIGWSGGAQCYVIEFKAKEPLKADAIVEMASHFYGGGTTPILGLAAADKIMDQVEFRKADVIKLSDGEAAFGPEDGRLRDKMTEKGVRFMGIGIGGTFGYLRALTDDVVDVHDFDLENPSEATAHLATHIT